MRNFFILVGIALSLNANNYSLSVTNSSEKTEDYVIEESTTFSRAAKKVDKDNLDCEESLNVSKNDKVITISSKSFSPLPIKLIVKDKVDNEKFTFINSNNFETTIFEILINKLSNEDKILITNRFDKTLFCKTVIKK